MADLKAIASQIRRDILEWCMVLPVVIPGGSLGCADFFTCALISKS